MHIMLGRFRPLSLWIGILFGNSFPIPPDWADFSHKTLVADVDDAMEMAVAPDGRVFFIEKAGKLKCYKPATGVLTVGTLSVFSGNEDGLLGIALDPNFKSNNQIYLSYSPAGIASLQRVSVFTLAGDQLNMGSEKMILEIPNDRPCCHSSGSIEFGPDGHLYIALGDETMPDQLYAAVDERPGRQLHDAQRTSANTNDLRGKILRITPNPAGGYSIPSGNLFPPGTANTRPEIYVMGARNPFHFSFDSKRRWLYYGEVGNDAINDDAQKGPKGYDEINQVRSAGNYGWPYVVADNKENMDFNYATNASQGKFNANALINDSPNNSGLKNLPPARPALIWWPYGKSDRFPEVDEGDNDYGGWGGRRAAMSGPVYYFDSSLASPTKLPAYFDDALFFWDWERNWIKLARMDAQGNFKSIESFVPGIKWNRVIDVKIGPEGSIYVLEWGNTAGNQGYDNGSSNQRLSRIDYVGKDNQPPVAIAKASLVSGAAPLTVVFSSAGSSHPLGLAFTNAWDFADGSPTSTEANPTHVYTKTGNFRAKLTLSDINGKTAVATLDISVGNESPKLTILSPVNGAFFQWGDKVEFKVAVSDKEDGDTENGSIPCSNVSLLQKLGHNDHGHPEVPIPGCQTVMQTPGAGHGDQGANLFVFLEASYTDKGGAGATLPLKGQALVILQPTRKQAEHFSRQQGIQIDSTGDPLGGAVKVKGVDPGDYLSFEPINLKGIKAVSYRVASGGPGGNIEVRADSPTGQVLSLCNIPVTGGYEQWIDATAPISDPGGTHELYFMFSGAGGAGSLFDLNWIRFDGIPPKLESGDVRYGFDDVTGSRFALNGVHFGIDFGTAQWEGDGLKWGGLTNFGFVSGGSENPATRSFTIPAGKVLKHILISGVKGSSYTFDDGVNPVRKGNIMDTVPFYLITEWSKPGSKISFSSSKGYSIGIDDITYGIPSGVTSIHRALPAPPTLGRGNRLLRIHGTGSGAAPTTGGIPGVEIFDLRGRSLWRLPL